MLQQQDNPTFSISKTLTGELYCLLDTTCKQGDRDPSDNWKSEATKDRQKK